MSAFCNVVTNGDHSIGYQYSEGDEAPVESGEGVEYRDSRLGGRQHRFIADFKTNREAREICDVINQDTGDRMYVEGNRIHCDNPVDLRQIRERVTQLHEVYINN